MPKPSKLAPKFNISACPWTPGMAFIPVLYTAARKAALLAQAEAVKASFCDLLLVIDNIGSGIDCSSQVTDWRFICADSVSKCLTHYYLELDWYMGRKASTLHCMILSNQPQQLGCIVQRLCQRSRCAHSLLSGLQAFQGYCGWNGCSLCCPACLAQDSSCWAVL